MEYTKSPARRKCAICQQMHIKKDDMIFLEYGARYWGNRQTYNYAPECLTDFVHKAKKLYIKNQFNLKK